MYSMQLTADLAVCYCCWCCMAAMQGEI